MTPTELPPVVARVLGLPEEEVALGSSLGRDLGLDRYDLAELLEELECALGVPLPQVPAPEWRTLADLARALLPHASGPT